MLFYIHVYPRINQSGVSTKYVAETAAGLRAELSEADWSVFTGAVSLRWGTTKIGK
jgi:hypothetical protein